MKTQHFHSSRGCLSYITYDAVSKQAALIDPSEEVGKSVYGDFLRKEGLSLVYIIETHTHADHISLAKEMKLATDAAIVRHAKAPSQTADLRVEGGEHLSLGTKQLLVMYTPGHTDESISLYNGAEIFTGDTLLIGGTGRTDFQIGDSSSLYKSIHECIGELPPETLVRPGHDYKHQHQTILQNELAMNPRLLMSESEFVQTMNGYHPPKPELFDAALKLNSQ